MANQIENKQTWGGETRQNHLYKPFLRGALATVLTLGCTLGALNLAVMGLEANLSAVWSPLIQAHAYAQMFGWVGLFIMGIAFHTIPRFYLRPLPRPRVVFLTFGLTLSGLVLRGLAQPLAGAYPGATLLVWLVPTSAALGFAGTTLFVWAMRDTLRNGSDRFGTPATGLFISAGFLWLWLTSAATVAVTGYLVVARQPTIPPALDAPYLRAVLSGAIVTTILGFTLRTIPHMLGLRPPSSRLMAGILAGYTIALLAQVAAEVGNGLAGGVAAWAPVLATVGAALELASALAFVWAVRIFDRSAWRTTHLARRNPWPERFVRTAYFWLLFAGGLSLALDLGNLAGRPVPHAFLAAYHHALTVGYMSMMIVGMSMRLVPVFIGAMNRHTRLAGVIYALLLAGNTARIVGQSLASLYGGAFFVLMGVSGLVEVCALCLYAPLLWRAMSRPSYGQAEQPAAGASRAPSGSLPL